MTNEWAGEGELKTQAGTIAVRYRIDATEGDEPHYSGWLKAPAPVILDPPLVLRTAEGVDLEIRWPVVVDDSPENAGFTLISFTDAAPVGA